MTAYTAGTAYVNHLDDDTGRIADRLPTPTSPSSTATLRRPRPTRSPRRRSSRRSSRANASTSATLTIRTDRTPLPHPLEPSTPEVPRPMSIHSTRRRLVAVTAAVTAALLLAACNGAANSDSDSDGDGDSTATARPPTRSRPTPAPSGDIDSFTWSLYAEPMSLDVPVRVRLPAQHGALQRLREPAALECRPVDLARPRDRLREPRPDDLGLHDPRRRHLP